MKYDSGSHAVSTEQGSSASQMTAATVMDNISRLLDAMDKQRTQYLLTPGLNGRRTALTECGKLSCKTFIWEKQHHSSTMFIWFALKENVS